MAEYMLKGILFGLFMCSIPLAIYVIEGRINAWLRWR